MDFFIKIKEKQLSLIKLNQLHVLPVNKLLDIHLNNTINKIYFILEGHEERGIIGSAVIKNYYHSITKEVEEYVANYDNVSLEDVSEPNVIDTRYMDDLFEMNEKETMFVKYLTKGFEAWKLEGKNRKKDFYDYLSFIKFSKNRESALKQEHTWSTALCLDNIQFTATYIPLHYFCDVKRMRAYYLDRIKECKAIGIKCYQCPYISKCLDEHVRLHAYALHEMKEEIIEVMYIANTKTGLMEVTKNPS